MNEVFVAIVLAFTLLAGFIFVVRFAERHRARAELARLISNGRVISASQAIDEYERGLGKLVKNESLLAGSWWFLRNDDNRDDCDLLTAVRQFGYVVLCKDSRERSAIEAYTRKVEVMLEPFDKQDLHQRT